MAAGIATLVLGFIIPVSLMLPWISNAGRSSFWILAWLVPALVVFLATLADCHGKDIGTFVVLVFFVLVLFCVNGYLAFLALVFVGPFAAMLASLPLLSAATTVLCAYDWHSSEELWCR